MEGLEFTGSLKGRAQIPLEMSVVRELAPEDLLVRSALTVGAKPPSIKALRAGHHKLAQCLASNFSDAEASVATGYSPSRISILKSDPAFQELLAFYKDTRKDVFVDVQQRMAGFATTAVEVLQERLEDNPDAFTNKDLNNLIKTTADRGGHSPIRKSESRHVILDASKLAQIKGEVEQSQNGQIRKINQEEEARRVAQFVRPELPGDPESPLSADDNRPPGDSSIEAETPGSAGEGANL